MFMAQDTVLEVEHVSKIYSRRREVTQRRLGGDFWRAVLARPYQPQSTELRPGEFYAVNDVSFSLKRGEAFGIIGLNGSGKTTLLRMLAGQIPPDRGQITVVGRTASMIDLTAGFQPSASGRENVFLRGGALGRSRAEMEASYDDIVAFAELGEAIDAPVASYSSGMTMRLAFSIVAAAAPDIMFIDEVLAVGDFRFRQKCLARVRELREHSAFVMVSHSMVDIARFCDRTIVLNKGVVVFHGPSPEAVEFFESEIEEQVQPLADRSLKKVLGDFFQNDSALSDVSGYWADADGNRITEVRQNDPLYFNLTFRCTIDTTRLTVGIPLWLDNGVNVTGFSTDRSLPKIVPNPSGQVSIRLRVPSVHFNPGIYHSTLGIVDGPEFLWRNPNEPLHVLPSITPIWGIATLPYDWEYVRTGQSVAG